MSLPRWTAVDEENLRRRVRREPTPVEAARDATGDRTFGTTGEAYAWAVGYLEGAVARFLDGRSKRAELRDAYDTTRRVLTAALQRVEAGR